MMRPLMLCFLLLFLLLGTGYLFAESGRIYGKLYTSDDEIFEGWIRWDKNEAFWDDPIDGTCERDRLDRDKLKGLRRYKDRRKSTVSIFGFKFGEEGDLFDLYGSASSCQLQFGHMKSLHNDGSDEVTIILKSGKEVQFSSGADLGDAVREILMSDIKEGDIYFDWEDIEKIEFVQEPNEPQDGLERLYGKVSTRRAGEFTGWIEWDVDEVFSKDDLDGDEEGGRSRKLAFERIASIERRSSSSATVTLKDGKEMVLRNSNDINSGNRGIVVKSPDFGRIKISWSEFEKAEFMPVPKERLPRYADFDASVLLQGTVTTEDGEQYTGHVVWDNDEEYSWEYINGEYKGVSIDIPFSSIAAIEKSSQRGAEITVKNGQVFLVRGSNDVDDSNKGIFIVRDDKKIEEVDWYDFAKLVLK